LGVQNFDRLAIFCWFGYLKYRPTNKIIPEILAENSKKLQKQTEFTSTTTMLLTVPSQRIYSVSQKEKTPQNTENKKMIEVLYSFSEIA
jgi:hypothetical protein